MFMLILANALSATAPLEIASIVERIECARRDISNGVVAMRYSDSRYGRTRWSCALTGFFDAEDRFGMEIRGHNAPTLNQLENGEPQCIQVFDGSKVIGMTREGAGQQFFVRSLADARYQMFNPRWLGLVSFPLAVAGEEDACFWRNGAVRVVSDPEADEGFVLMEVRHRTSSGEAPLTTARVDSRRGWNIVSIRSEVAGRVIEIDTELARFGEVWFPRVVEMRHFARGAETTAIESRVVIESAEFNVDRLSDEDFSWSRLGPPAKAPRVMVVDYRANERLQYGFWNGQFMDRPRRD